MKNYIKTLAILSALALATSVQAQITYSTGGSLTAWNGTPVYVSLANSALSGATTGQGDQTITGTYGLMAETFTPSSSFTLGSFAVLMGMNNNTDSSYQINLYDLGTAGTVSVSSSAATYTPVTSLFSDTSISFTSTSGGEVQGTFTLPVADQVTLNAGEEYAIEIWNPTADGSAGITWFRGSTADPGGQMFSGGDAVGGARNTLAANGQAGGAPRTGALALYQVPEPASMTLMGLGMLAGLIFIRRRNG